MLQYNLQVFALLTLRVLRTIISSKGSKRTVCTRKIVKKIYLNLRYVIKISLVVYFFKTMTINTSHVMFWLKTRCVPKEAPASYARCPRMAISVVTDLTLEPFFRN